MAGKDKRAKDVSAQLGIAYVHALRLVREYCANLSAPTTREEIVAGVIRAYESSQAFEGEMGANG